MTQSRTSADEAPDVDAIEAHIAQTRADLADTVDQLAARLDVKTRARERVKLTQSQLHDRVRSARDRATNEDGRPSPQAIVASVAAVALITTVTAVIIRRR